MACEQYVVVPGAAREPSRWFVRRGGETYGEYLSKDSAIQDAVEAAQDAGLRGAEAQVLVEDAAGAARIEWTFGFDRYPPERLPA
jgi:hypothetical protein